MSEYQYYEFQAIDRPLTAEQVEELAALSSRAEITSTSFINEYNYGSFRGNVKDVLAKYFDAFLYVANWGTHRLAFRLPRSLVDVEALEAYCNGEVVSLSERGDHVLLDFSVHIEGGGNWEQGKGYLAPLIGLRADILAGDLRPVYVAWLASLASFESQTEDDDLEPPVPPGLGKPSAALEVLANFLWVDEDVLEVATRGSAPGGPTGPSSEELSAWIAAQPEAKKNAWLLALAEDDKESVSPRYELLRQFREAWSAGRPRASGGQGERRTVGELVRTADGLAEERKQREKKAKAHKAEREAKAAGEARNKHLDSLMGRETELWRTAEAAIATTKPAEYARAAELLVDLRDLARRQNASADFLARLVELREKHRNKRTFITRLDSAGLR